MSTLLTVHMVAQLFCVKRTTVYRWIREGKVFESDTIKKIPGGLRIPHEEVERAIKALPTFK